MRVDSVRRGTIEKSLIFVGNIEAVAKANITPHASGKVAKIYVDVGDVVRRGQRLAELDNTHLRLEIERAKANLEFQRVNVEEAKNTLHRMERLFREAAVTAQQYERARFAFEAAHAQLRAAQAALNLLQHELDLTFMTAPFDGIVAKRLADEGDFVNPAMGGIVLVLLDTSRVKVEFHVAGQDLPYVRKGQRVVLSVPSLDGRHFEGRITTIDRVADPLSKTFKAVAEFQNDGGELRPGLFGEVRVVIEERKGVLLVRKEAVLDDAIFVVEDGVARKRMVERGLADPSFVEIRAGLKEGELYIFEGATGLREGSKVKVVE